MDGVASAAMKSDNVALGFDCCLFQFMGFLSRTKHTDFSDTVRWWECEAEGGSEGLGPRSFLTPSGQGTATGDGLASGARRDDPRERKGGNCLKQSRVRPDISPPAHTRHDKTHVEMRTPATSRPPAEIQPLYMVFFVTREGSWVLPSPPRAWTDGERYLR